jgi:hypothetical protein
MQRFRLAADPDRNALHYRDWLLAESVAWWHPYADPDRLQIAADYVGWVFTPFDDVFDGPIGRNVFHATQICNEQWRFSISRTVLSLHLHPHESRRSRDLWQRSRRGRSLEWRQRAATDWRNYFAAQMAEVVNRVHGRVSTLRQLTIIKCAYPIFDMIEVVHDFELPPIVWHTPLLTELRDCIAEVITATNELVSADKEASAGDAYNNLLLIAVNRDGCSRVEAFHFLADMVAQRFEMISALEQQIDDLGEILSEAERENLRRYVQCLHNIAAGDNRWERISGRYRP